MLLLLQKTNCPFVSSLSTPPTFLSLQEEEKEETAEGEAPSAEGGAEGAAVESAVAAKAGKAWRVCVEDPFEAHDLGAVVFSLAFQRMGRSAGSLPWCVCGVR